MISGLNQEIDLLGKTFHFQTELSDQDGLSIRTEVFVGGKVVATREVRLEADDDESEEAVRALIKEHHQQTVTTFVTRARRYQQRGDADATGDGDTPGARSAPEPPAEPSASPPEPATPGLPEAPRPPLAPAPVEATDEVARAIQIRRLFGQLRRLVDPAAPAPDNLSKPLAKTAQTLTWMIRSPIFADVRIDEQARCHLLKEQIDEWLVSGRDPWRGAQIWSGVVTFGNYLAEINLRAELVSYDQQTLVWALEEVQERGMSDGVLERLASLYGRHPRLDQLLDAPDGVAAAAWAAHLRSVLTRI